MPQISLRVLVYVECMGCSVWMEQGGDGGAEAEAGRSVGWRSPKDPAYKSPS